MSGGVIFPTVGRDAIVQMIMDDISYFKFGEGGFVLSGETTEEITASAAGGQATYTYTISGGDFSISDVNLGSNYFEFVGEYAEYFPVGARIYVEGSIANDGYYTVASAAEPAFSGNTQVTVEETIPDATPDGLLYVSHLPLATGPAIDATHWPMVVEEVTPGDAQVQVLTDTVGDGTLTGNGSGTIDYKNGDLAVTFTANVTAGNIVRVRFKYRDVRKDAAGGLAYTDLESVDSPIAGDGLHELYTFTKLFSADVETYVEFRGTGYATIRCHLKLQSSEGFDDGRGLTYGGTPFYFEGGVFDDEDVMLAYFTFDKQRKTGAIVIEHTVDFQI